MLYSLALGSSLSLSSPPSDVCLCTYKYSQVLHCFSLRPGGVEPTVSTRMAHPAHVPMSSHLAREDAESGEAQTAITGRPRILGPCRKPMCFPAGAWKPRLTEVHRICHPTRPPTVGRIVRTPEMWPWGSDSQDERWGLPCLPRGSHAGAEGYRLRQTGLRWKSVF